MKRTHQTRAVGLACLLTGAGASQASGQSIMTAVECIGQRGRVTFTFTGWSPNTCALSTELEVVGDEIRLAYRPYDGDKICGDTQIRYCFMLATEPLRDGVYRVMTSANGGPYGEADRVAVACADQPLLMASPLGHPDGTVRAIAAIDLDDGGPEPESLIVAGDFTQIGDIHANRIARWDGSAWHALADGLDGPVAAITFHDGSLYAGGRFSNAGGVEARSIARWDGGAWHAVGSGFETAFEGVPTVMALTTFRGDLVAGGSFLFAGDASVRRAARWDGKQWVAMGLGLEGDVSGWGPITHVSAWAHYQGDLIAGGQFTSADGVYTNGLARWDGTHWHAIADAAPGAALAVTDAGLAVVSSSWSFFHYCSESVVQTWDGAAWPDLGVGHVPGGALVAATVHQRQLVVASGGDFSSGCCRKEILRRYGERWERLGDAGDGRFHALGVYRGELIAGGSFDQVNGVQISNIVRFGARCRADVNLSGGVDSQDFFDFLAAFAAGHGEFNADGVFDSQDLFDFLTSFFGGCE